jgi:N-acetylneuraminate synthase
MNIFDKVKKQGYFLIAEIGVNYYDIAAQRGMNLLDAAKLMIDEAVNSGLDAVKFQTYKAEKLASRYSPAYWDTNEESTTSQYELFKKFDSFGFDEYKELAEYCKEKDIVFLSTPFDFDSADYLESLMPAYKISSSDITNIPFIKHIAKKNKPILLSTGASNINEIKTAVNTIEDEGLKDIVVMHCVLEYPTPYEDANLDMILSLKKEFPNKLIGYSDHTKPDECMDVIKTAWLLGATVIEKHFTLDKTLKGNDHYHAMDPSDAKKIKEGLEFIKTIRGNEQKKCLDSEMISRMNARRSIVVNTNIKAGTIITKEMITFKRPGIGISPSEVNNVIGKTAKVDINEDTILQYEMLD